MGCALAAWVQTAEVGRKDQICRFFLQEPLVSKREQRGAHSCGSLLPSDRASVGTMEFLRSELQTFGEYQFKIQGWPIRWTPGSVNMWWKSCVLLPAACRCTQFFSSYSQNLGSTFQAIPVHGEDKAVLGPAAYLPVCLRICGGCNNHKKTLNEVFAEELSHRQSAMWSFNRGIKLPNKAFGCRFEKCLRQAQNSDSRRTGRDVTAQWNIA